jgi:hypothetical protein
MIETAWIKNLKPGDEVALERTGFHRGIYSLAKVQKVTRVGGGRIHVNGLVFDQLGAERRNGVSYLSRLYIREATAAIREEIARQEHIENIRELASGTAIEALPTVTLGQIRMLFEGKEAT